MRDYLEFCYEKGDFDLSRSNSTNESR